MRFVPKTFFKIVNQSNFSNGFYFDHGYNYASSSSLYSKNKLFEISTIDGIEYNSYNNCSYRDNILHIRIPENVPITESSYSKNYFNTPTLYVEDIWNFKQFLKDDTILPEIKRTMETPDIRMGLFQLSKTDCLAAVKNDGNILEFIKEEFMKDENFGLEISYEAVKSNGYAVRFVPSRYLTKKIALTAVKNHYSAIENIPTSVLDKEICLKAVQSNDHSIQYIPRSFLDEEICFEAVKRDPNCIKYLKTTSFFNKKLCFEAIKENRFSIDYCDFKSYDDWMSAVKISGYNITKVPLYLIDSKICIEAVKKDPSIIQYIPTQFHNEKLFSEAIRSETSNCSSNAISYIPDKWLTKKLCLEAVRKDGMSIEHIPVKYIDEEICLEAVRNKGKAVRYIELKNLTKKICEEAVKNDPKAATFVHPSFL